MKKEYTFNSPSVKKMLETVDKYMTISKWKEKNYEIVIEKDKECKMNNRFLDNKIDCKNCQYKHICKNYTEEIKYEN